MSKKNGFSMLEAITPRLRLLPPARFRACRLGWYFSSSMARSTRARVELFTMLVLLRTRDTVAVDTLARRATCSRFMGRHLIVQIGGRNSVSAYRARFRRREVVTPNFHSPVCNSIQEDLGIPARFASAWTKLPFLYLNLENPS